MKIKSWIIISLCVFLVVSCKLEVKNNGKTAGSNDSIVATEDSVAPQHQSKTSIDWEGEYKGVLPCEDCDGVETSLTLNFDNTFTQRVTYIGKGGPYESSGTFIWDNTGEIVTLKFADGSAASYRVEEGVIKLLDENTLVEIEGDEYVLRK